MSTQTINQRGLSVLSQSRGRGISVRNDRRFMEASEKIEIEKRKAIVAAHPQSELYMGASRMARDSMGRARQDFDELAAQDASLKPEADDWFNRLTASYKEKTIAGYNTGMDRIQEAALRPDDEADDPLLELVRDGLHLLRGL